MRVGVVKEIKGAGRKIKITVEVKIRKGNTKIKKNFHLNGILKEWT